jgi:hypothetical protein
VLPLQLSLAAGSITCTDAVLVINTGSTRLTNISVTGDAQRNSPADLLLGPQATFNCTVRVAQQQLTAGSAVVKVVNSSRQCPRSCRCTT